MVLQIQRDRSKESKPHNFVYISFKVQQHRGGTSQTQLSASRCSCALVFFIQSRLFSNLLCCLYPLRPCCLSLPFFPPGGSIHSHFISPSPSPISPQLVSPTTLLLSHTLNLGLLTTLLSQSGHKDLFIRTYTHHRHNDSFTSSQLLPCCPAGHGQQPTR